MVDRRTGVFLAAVMLAVVVMAVSTLSLQILFNLGSLSFISIPLTIVGFLLTLDQYLVNPRSEGVKKIVHERTHTVEPMIEQGNEDPNWTDMSDEETAEEIQNNLDWRAFEDNSFETWRSIGKQLNRMSVVARDSPYMTQHRIFLLLIALSMTGGMWLFLILVEVMGSSWPKQNYMTVIAELSPLSISFGDAILSVFPAVILLIAPLAYLQFKSDYTCPECQEPFGLSSKGRHFRPKHDIVETDNGREVHGQRILRCENCENIEVEQADWVLGE